MTTSFRLLIVAMLVLTETQRLHAQEWTRFRGPNGSGECEETAIPVEFSEKDFNWKTELPGVGNSSPVVWGDKVFVLSADAKDATRYVLCLDATTGKIRWRRSYPSQPHPIHARSSYASCTPAVDAERVYVAWSTPDETTLLACDHEGREVWRLDLGPWVSQHGFGTSPILYEDLVILNNSQDGAREAKKPGESYVMAFDCRTGELRWKTPRISEVVSYSVPCIYRGPDGRDQLICTSTAEGVYSLDPRTGKENWKVANAFSMRTVSSPAIVDGVIFGSTGQGGFATNYVVAIRPEPSPAIAYEIKRQAPYVPCVVGKDQLAFLWFDAGIVSCIEAATGKVYWRERVGGTFSGSPVRVGDKLYCIDEEGVVVVLAADKQFKLLAKNPLGEPSRSTPAIAGGRMYLRTLSHLISVGGKQQAE